MKWKLASASVLNTINCYGSSMHYTINELNLTQSTMTEQTYIFQIQQESVRPRWPYDMRPSARAEKYMCVIVIR